MLNDSCAIAQPTSADAFSQMANFQFRLQYPREEAAGMLGISIRTIDRLIAEKQITVRRIGRRVLITHDALTQFIKRDHRTNQNPITLCCQWRSSQSGSTH